MREEHATAVLTAEDGPASRVINPSGSSRILLTCEHASNSIPKSLDRLGLSEDVLKSHAAWDPGALDLALLLSERLDATLVAAEFSRLVFDVNRPPEAADAIRSISEVHRIARNAEVSAGERAARKAALYDSFHAAVAEALDEREEAGRDPILVTVHSFTPVYFGKQRAVELGILFDADRRLAEPMLELATRHTSLAARTNEPYGPEDGVTHTLRRHAIPRGIANVMLEIRNDLLRDATGRARIAGELAGLLSASIDRLNTAEQSAEAEG